MIGAGRQISRAFGWTGSAAAPAWKMGAGSMTLGPVASILWAQAEEIFPAMRGNKLTVRVVIHITVTPLRV